MTDDVQSEQVIRDLIAYSNGDSSKADAISESVDVYNPGLPGGEAHSRDTWDAYNREIKEGFPDFHVEEEELVVSGDIGMAELKITGTHEGEFKGLPPTGREVEIWAMSKYVIEDGQVKEWYTYYDTGELQSQLGLTFPEVLGQLPELVWGKLHASI